MQCRLPDKKKGKQVADDNDSEDSFNYDEELDNIDVPNFPSLFNGATKLDSDLEGKNIWWPTNVDDQYVVAIVKRVVSPTKQVVDVIGSGNDDFIIQDEAMILFPKKCQLNMLITPYSIKFTFF